jgi:8-oxo-dGTP diphosphatase
MIWMRQEITDQIHVSCAIIEHGGQVLAARRGLFTRLPLKWEFPGGKIDPREDPQACLLREIHEELDMVVVIHTALPLVSHRYPFFGVTLHPYICTAGSNRFTLNEHVEAVWLQPEELPGLDWAEADVPVLHAYLSWLKKGRS